VGEREYDCACGSLSPLGERVRVRGG